MTEVIQPYGQDQKQKNDQLCFSDVLLKYDPREPDSETSNIGSISKELLATILDELKQAKECEDDERFDEQHGSDRVADSTKA